MRWSGRVKLVFLAPAVIWVLAFTVFPLVYSLYISFHKVESKMQVEQVRVPLLDAAGQPVLDAQGKAKTKLQVNRQNVTTYTYMGLFNYVRMFNDGQVASAVKVSAIFTLVAVPAEIVLGILLALLFNREMPMRGVLRMVMILPIFATPLAVGYLFFTILYEEGGPLAFLGLPFLSDPGWALFSVIFVDIWQWTPFCFLVSLAALQGMPEEAIENARLDTNSRWLIFWGVIAPYLQPTLIIVLLLRLAEALKLFDIPFALTGGGPGVATQSYSFFAYRVGLRYFDVSYASALAYGLLIVVMIVITLFFKRLRSTYA